MQPFKAKAQKSSWCYITGAQTAQSSTFSSSCLWNCTGNATIFGRPPADAIGSRIKHLNAMIACTHALPWQQHLIRLHGRDTIPQSSPSLPIAPCSDPPGPETPAKRREYFVCIHIHARCISPSPPLPNQFGSSRLSEAIASNALAYSMSSKKIIFFLYFHVEHRIQLTV